MSLVDKIWYHPKWYHWIVIVLLLPLSVLFWMLSSARRGLFKSKLKASNRLSVPIIVVGNISVGGNGKTPLVVYLANRLKQQGYRVGVLSRGYGGKANSYPMSVGKDSTPEQVGDEPILMRSHINCPLMVDPNRTRGAQGLIDKHNCNLILCDDGLQHYAMQRDIEIAVIDGKRQLGNGFLLPAGPLREGRWRLHTVDLVVLNGGNVRPNQYLMGLETGQLVNVKQPSKTMPISQISGAVVAAAGIGNPSRFFDLLEQKQVKIKQRLSFVDHHNFSEHDLPNETVLMTEKDAVKCTGFAHPDWWYLPVKATLPAQFEQQLFDLIRLRAGNSSSK